MPKKIQKTLGTPPVPGGLVFLKKISKHHISGVSCPILMILDSKKGFLRSGNLLESFPEPKI